jgi:hypothetical protein
VKRGHSKAGPRRLGAFLPGNLTNALNHHVDEGLRLRQAWISCLPEPLASHSRPVRYAAGLLFVHVDTPAWASRLRHQQPALVSTLRRDPALRDLVDLRVRVVPAGSSDLHAVPERPRSRLSAKAAQTIERAVDSVSDPGLRAALGRLAERGGSAPPKRRS